MPPQVTGSTNDWSPTSEEAASALADFHRAAHALLGLHLARTRSTNPAKFELVKATLQAGGFAVVQTSYEQQGNVINTSLWLHGPFGGSAEWWDFAEDFH